MRYIKLYEEEVKIPKYIVSSALIDGIVYFYITEIVNIRNDRCDIKYLYSTWKGVNYCENIPMMDFNQNLGYALNNAKYSSDKYLDCLNWVSFMDNINKYNI